MTDRTIDFYELNAGSYAELTLKADLTELRGRFLSQLAPGARILDVGCGAGRDLRAYKDAVFAAEVIEPAAALAKMASEFSGCPVRVAKIEEFDEKDTHPKFDGIWACASLLHLRRADLPRALTQIRHSLRESGVLFVSMQQGLGERFAPDGRFYCLYLEEELLRAIQDAGFVALDIWESGDALPNRSSIRWINVLARAVHS